MTKQRIVTLTLLLTPPFLALFLFGFTLNYYFFQDDWFNFNISNINSSYEFFDFFKYRNDIIAYRPLEIQTQYFLIRKFFGLNAFSLRVVNFSLLFISYILLIYLLRKILKNSRMALFSAALWVTSSFQFMNLGMINYHLWGTMSWLINYLIILKYINTKKFIFYFLSFIVYVISLGIWEFAISLPIVVSAYLFLISKYQIKNIIKLLLPFYLLSAIYIIARLIFVAHLTITEYQTTFNFDSVKAFFWYILWSFNIPEEFKKQTANNLIIFRVEFLKNFWKLVLVTFTGATLLITLGIIYPLYKTLKSKNVVDIRLIIFFLFWFGVAIFPALLLPNHNFMMYLTLPSIAIYSIISIYIFTSNLKYLWAIVLILWVLISAITVDFYSKGFSNRAQQVSKKFVYDMKSRLPNFPPNSLVYYKLSFHGDRHALLNQNAIQAIYEDKTINIAYDYDSFIELLIKKDKKRSVYIYEVARHGSPPVNLDCPTCF